MQAELGEGDVAASCSLLLTTFKVSRLTRHKLQHALNAEMSVDAALAARAAEVADEASAGKLIDPSGATQLSRVALWEQLQARRQQCCLLLFVASSVVGTTWRGTTLAARLPLLPQVVGRGRYCRT